MKKTLHVILKTLAVLGVLAVPLSFIFGGSLIGPSLDKVLRLKIDPRFSGGDVMSEFIDPYGDESGSGALSYPSHQAFAGSGWLDILRYRVYEPLVDPAWSDDGPYWQLGIGMAALGNPLDMAGGFSHPEIRIYIDLDGAASGSTEGVDPRGELVSFDPEHPWDIVVSINGAQRTARLRDDEGILDERITMIAVEETGSIYVRIPLKHPQVKAILDGRKSWHYLLCGIHDPWAPGEFMAVKARSSSGSGGGAASSLTPKVYDILCPESSSQASILSSFDEENFSYALLRPVLASRDGRGSLDIDARLADVRREMEEAAKVEALSARASLPSGLASGDPRLRAEALFRAARHAEAKDAFAAILSADPDDAIALAYSGSLVAMEAGKTNNPAQAVSLVQDAFRLLDRAVGIAMEGHAAGALPADDLIACLMNRAEVSASVPEAVFGKSSQAAADFSAIAEIALAGPAADIAFAGDCLVRAGLCLEAAGNRGAAEVSFARSASFVGLGPRARYELLKRGFHTQD